VIVFDTNQLRRALPGSPALVMLKAAADLSGHTLAITDIVLSEAVRQRRDELRKQIREVGASHREFNKLVRPASRTSDPLAGAGMFSHQLHPERAEVAYFEAGIRSNFRVLETDPDDAREALFREADRRPPCKANGEGGRDTAIFLTALRATASADLGRDGRTLPVIFVTEDSAFSDAKDRGSLAPGLLGDVAGRDLVLKPDVVQTLAAIGYPTSWVDPSPITDRDEFGDLLREALEGPVLEGLSAEYPPSLLARAALERPNFTSSGKAPQCLGEGLTMTTVTLRWWGVVLNDGQVPASVREWIQAKQLPESLTFGGFHRDGEATALVVQDAAGAILSAQFSVR